MTPQDAFASLNRMTGIAPLRIPKFDGDDPVAPTPFRVGTAASAALALAGEAVARSLVVDPYAVEVELRNGHYAPKALREAIRASGPTVRRDLGKQAQGQAPVFALHANAEGPHVSL